MKHGYLALFCTLFTISIASAQIGKGTWTFGGGASADYVDGKQFDGYFAISLDPQFAVFVTDHWMLGGSVGGSLSSAGSTDGDAFISPVVRYYFNPAAEKNFFFAGASAGFVTNDDVVNNVNLEVGLTRFLAPSLAMEIGAGVAITPNDDPFFLGMGLRAFMSQEQRANGLEAESSFGRGTWLLGANSLGFTTTSDYLNFNIAPNIGYFVSDQLAVGLRAGLQKTFFFDDLDIRSRSWQVQPFARYYLAPARRLNWFGEVSAGLVGTYIRNGDDFTIASYRPIVEGAAGLSFFLAENVALEASLAYQRMFEQDITKLKVGTNTNVVGSDGPQDNPEGRMGINVGFQFFLGRN